MSRSNLFATEFRERKHIKHVGEHSLTACVDFHASIIGTTSWASQCITARGAGSHLQVSSDVDAVIAAATSLRHPDSPGPVELLELVMAQSLGLLELCSISSRRASGVLRGTAPQGARPDLVFSTRIIPVGLRCDMLFMSAALCGSYLRKGATPASPAAGSVARHSPVTFQCADDCECWL